MGRFFRRDGVTATRFPQRNEWPGQTGWQAWLLCLLLAVLLMWPAAMFGRPGYIADSAGYHHGGAKAVAFLVDRLAPPASSAPPAPDTTSSAAEAVPKAPDKEDDGTQAVRSIIYSVFTYVLDAPNGTLLALVAAHAVLVAIVTLLFMRATGISRDPPLLALAIAILVLGTALPSFVTLATPDVFAGVAILGITLLALHAARLSLAERVIVAGITGFAISVHSSHLLLAIGMALLLLVHIAWRLRLDGWRVAALRPAWAFGSILFGLALVMASALVGFGEVSVAPKRYPFALARAIEDGPARWYLEDKCPTAHFAVCELYPEGRFPDRAGYFLWGSQGIAARATAEQMDRIRDEELEIVRRATAAYPEVQLRSSLANLREQILSASIDPAMFRDRVMAGSERFDYAEEEPEMAWHAHVQLTLLLGALALIALRFGKATPVMRESAVLILLGILGNDVICAVVAAPDIRYQNRLLWLIPLLAIALVRRRAPDQAPEPPVNAGCSR